MEEKKEILQRIKKIIQEKEPEAHIYLYGSRARGDEHNESDWDIMILLNKDVINFDVEKSIFSSLYDLELEIGEVISPLIYSENEWNTKYTVTPFYHIVMNEGYLI